MLVDFSKLNAAFGLSGPHLYEVEDEPIGPDTEYIWGYSGKKHTDETKELQRQASAGENNPRYGVRLTEEERKACGHGQYYYGDKNPNARTYIFTNPEGEEFSVVGKFKSFCHENGLPYATMHAAVFYKREGPRRNGWAVRRLE